MRRIRSGALWAMGFVNVHESGICAICKKSCLRNRGINFLYKINNRNVDFRTVRSKKKKKNSVLVKETFSIKRDLNVQQWYWVKQRKPKQCHHSDVRRMTRNKYFQLKNKKKSLKMVTI